MDVHVLPEIFLKLGDEAFVDVDCLNIALGFGKIVSQRACARTDFEDMFAFFDLCLVHDPFRSIGIDKEILPDFVFGHELIRSHDFKVAAFIHGWLPPNPLYFSLMR